MKIAAVYLAFVCALPGAANAVCGRPADYSSRQAIQEAQYVFVATITEAHLERDSNGKPKRVARGRELSRYTIQYAFDVSIPIKGDASAIHFLTTDGIWQDPNNGRFGAFSEQSRFVPGDSVLVVADAPGEVPISRIPECTDSMPWGKEASDIVKSIYPNRFPSH